MSHVTRAVPETPFRAHMLRRATRRPAIVKAARPHAVHRVAVKRHGPRRVHKVRPVKAVVARPAVPARRPTPVVQAAREVAVPKSFALIATTICETQPAATPVLYMARAPLPPAVGPGAPAETQAGPGPGPGPEAVWTPLPFTPGLPPPRVDTLTPAVTSPQTPGQTPGQPPVETPPGPPPPEQPPETPPQTPPDTPPEGPPPPIAPPPEGPPVISPPPIAPPPVAVPEPSAWVLILAGFGGVGAALRRRRLTHNGRSATAKLDRRD